MSAAGWLILIIASLLSFLFNTHVWEITGFLLFIGVVNKIYNDDSLTLWFLISAIALLVGQISQRYPGLTN